MAVRTGKWCRILNIFALSSALCILIPLLMHGGFARTTNVIYTVHPYKTADLNYKAEMMQQLNNERVAQDDPRLIKLIRDYYIEAPSRQPYNLRYPNRTDYSKGQAPFVDSRLNYIVS